MVTNAFKLIQLYLAYALISASVLAGGRLLLGLKYTAPQEFLISLGLAAVLMLALRPWRHFKEKKGRPI
ncbi:hypothetical protein [Mesorhizobium sp. SP-1A]|uniref:hypothetical protein n=1 Tax=Mesorhizobium sp. SP-1A TaxID=3077840 RepID=UPI0028F70354|nr:hypothetical protein [Mesorhizobium sp. SP-1A]